MVGLVSGLTSAPPRWSGGSATLHAVHECQLYSKIGILKTPQTSFDTKQEATVPPQSFLKSPNQSTQLFMWLRVSPYHK